ncbi:MAG: DUF423 domain-containing protein [Bacteroidia bacterium]|nr:DUF423 domain-containing protein [Bacteroidia bacterium]NNC85179.1 DUF423 domain-containing protein [Bacteroidia bacterium]NNM16899.1 DUF423 domain-containing protein [Bacteroidia bacterium]
MKKYLVIAGILAGLGVILGAMGAHGLRNDLDPVQLNSYLTGVRYQFYHAFAILITCLLYMHFKQKQFLLANLLFFIGILLFSGSIYILSTKGVTGIELPRAFGFVTPVGGLVFVAAWLVFVWGCLKIKNA